MVFVLNLSAPRKLERWTGGGGFLAICTLNECRSTRNNTNDVMPEAVRGLCDSECAVYDARRTRGHLPVSHLPYCRYLTRDKFCCFY